jgi:hypothetical protein
LDYLTEKATEDALASFIKEDLLTRYVLFACTVIFVYVLRIVESGEHSRFHVLDFNFWVRFAFEVVADLLFLGFVAKTKVYGLFRSKMYPWKHQVVAFAFILTASLLFTTTYLLQDLTHGRSASNRFVSVFLRDASP